MCVHLNCSDDSDGANFYRRLVLKKFLNSFLLFSKTTTNSKECAMNRNITFVRNGQKYCFLLQQIELSHLSKKVWTWSMLDQKNQQRTGLISYDIELYVMIPNILSSILQTFDTFLSLSLHLFMDVIKKFFKNWVRNRSPIGLKIVQDFLACVYDRG